MDLKDLFLLKSISGDGLKVDSAEVGQTIVVKEIDETGKPIAWEAAELPKGEDWELITTLSITTDEQIQRISYDFDKPYKKLYVTFGTGGEVLCPGSNQSTHAWVAGWKNSNSNWQNIGTVPYAKNTTWTGYTWLAELLIDDAAKRIQIVSQSLGAGNGANAQISTAQGGYTWVTGFTAFEMWTNTGYYFSSTTINVWGVPL